MKMFVVCTHALCKLHTCIVQTAGTHCARCTPALCKLDARTVHTARTHCAHCTHRLCKLAACTVHAARTHCAHCTQTLCMLHARIVHAARTHCTHCTHLPAPALCTLHAHTVNICTVRMHAFRTFHTRTVNMRTVHTVRMHCAHCTIFWQDLCIYSSLLAIPGNILCGASVLAYFMEAFWI